MRQRHNLLIRRPGGSSLASSSYPTPQSSALPTDAEDNEEDDTPAVASQTPFRFRDLPSELRLKIYGYLFETVPKVIDLDYDNYRLIHRKQNIFYASRQVWAEASHYFYAQHAFRIFTCTPGRFFKTKRPLLARLSPRCRACLTTLELRLGPGFASPPKGWAVTPLLGLQDCTNVRRLKVFVQVDTSNPIYEGFRAKGAEDSYFEVFSKTLLKRILEALPNVIDVQLDAYPGVEKDGPMVIGLISVVKQFGRTISYGPERGWRHEITADIFDALLAQTAALRITEATAEVAVH